MLKIIGKILCLLKGKHRYQVTARWNSDVDTYSPCLYCGHEKKQDPIWPHVNEKSLTN